MGTNPLLAWGTDANPADFNSDTLVDGLDMDTVAADFGQTVPPALVRKDIAPEPSGDNHNEGLDMDAEAGFFGSSVTP